MRKTFAAGGRDSSGMEPHGVPLRLALAIPVHAEPRHREDESRVRNRILADNVAWLKRFAISLLKQVNDKESVAMRRRMAGWNPAYLFKVLQIPA